MYYSSKKPGFTALLFSLLMFFAFSTTSLAQAQVIDQTIRPGINNLTTYFTGMYCYIKVGDRLIKQGNYIIVTSAAGGIKRVSSSGNSVVYELYGTNDRLLASCDVISAYPFNGSVP